MNPSLTLSVAAHALTSGAGTVGFNSHTCQELKVKENRMDYTVAVGWYKINADREKIEGKFSGMVKELLDKGWQFKGELKVHQHVDLPDIYVLLVQEFQKGF